MTDKMALRSVVVVQMKYFNLKWYKRLEGLKSAED